MRLPTRGSRKAPGRFRFAVPALITVWLAAGNGRAQLQVRLELEHRSFMVGEPFMARVLVENQGSTPVVLGDAYHNAELFIELVPRGSGPLPEAQRRQVRRDRVIMMGERDTELVEVTSLFEGHAPGTYLLRALMRYEDRLYQSNAIAFDRVRGIEMQSVRRALPGYHDIVLLYSLRYTRRDAGEVAFLVIEDSATGDNYGTFTLGPSVRVNPPAISFDSQGRAVVVHQSGRNRFTRSVVSADRDGAAFVAQTHHLPDGKPYPGQERR